jgi:hypothetical protein
MLHEVTLPIFMNNRKFKTKKFKNRNSEIRLILILRIRKEAAAKECIKILQGFRFTR